MNTAAYVVKFVPAHFNRAGLIDVADYWYFETKRGRRMMFDTKAEAKEAAAEMRTNMVIVSKQPEFDKPD